MRWKPSGADAIRLAIPLPIGESNEHRRGTPLAPLPPVHRGEGVSNGHEPSTPSSRYPGERAGCAWSRRPVRFAALSSIGESSASRRGTPLAPLPHPLPAYREEGDRGQVVNHLHSAPENPPGD